jgi:hypothetical protein
MVRVFAHGIPKRVLEARLDGHPDGIRRPQDARSRLLCPIGLDRDGLPLISGG